MRDEQPFKVVLVDHVWPDLRLEHNLFFPMGINFIATNCVTEDDVIAVAGNADVLIAEYAPITERVISSLTKCKLIGLNATGYDNVDLASATRAGIMVSNCPDYCCDEVADHTMALILACARGVLGFSQRISEGVWDFKSAGPLMRVRDSVLGLIGFGEISQSVAYRARAFGMNVMAWDPFGKIKDSAYLTYGVQKASLQEILQISDYVSVHASLSDKTRNLIAAPELGVMKNSAYLLNLGRGGIVNENQLAEALKLGRIRGAALDVLNTEPPDFEHPLFKLDNVIVTPHAAFYSEEAMTEVRTRIAREVVRFFNGEKLENLVNPASLNYARQLKDSASVLE